MQLKTLPLLLFLPSFLALNHDIQGGPDVTFTPNTTSTSPGSTLTIHFHSRAPNVAQSLFSTPCNPSPEGFYSGFVVPSSSDTQSPTTFIVTVNDANPIWFYCTGGSEYMHCQLGMVGVVNPRYVLYVQTGNRGSGDTLTAYALAASNSMNSTTSSSVGGGVFSSTRPNPAPTATSNQSSSGTGSGTSTSNSPTQSTSAGVTIESGNVFLNGITAVVLWVLFGLV